jgi:signal transduction histidine kinase
MIDQAMTASARARLPLLARRATVMLLFAVAALPILAAAGWQTWDDLARREAAAGRDRAVLARSAALAAQAFVEGNLGVLDAISRQPALAGPPDDPRAAALLQAELAAHPNWETLSLLDGEGWNLVVAGLPAAPRTVNLADRPQVQRALATGKPAVGPAAVSRARTIPVVGLAAAVETPSGRRVLLAPLSLDALRDQLQSSLADAAAPDLLVVDEQGRAFLHPDAAVARTLPSLRGRPDVEAALTRQTGSLRFALPDGSDLLGAYAPVEGTGWAVLTEEPTATAFAAARREAAATLILLALTMAATGVLAWYLGGRLADTYRRVDEGRALAERARAEAEDARAATERAARRTAALGALAADLAAAATVEEVAAASVRHAIAATGAFAGTVARPSADGTALDLLLSLGYPAAVETLRQLPSGVPTPLGDAIRTGRPVLLGTRSERETTYPHMAPLHETIGGGAFAAIPLIVEGRTLGALGLNFASARTFDDDDRALLGVLAGQAAQAFGRARLYDEVRAAVEARDEFLSVAAHELRTPVTTIKGFAQGLQRAQRRGRADPERVARALEQIDRASTRLNNLVGDLLEIGRIRSGRFTLRRQNLALAALVREVVERHRAMAGGAHRLTVDLPGVGPTVRADPERLEQVLGNLLDNAVKYSPEGGEVRVSLRAEGAGAVLTVRDEGIGLPPGAEEAIFEPFGRAANAQAGQLPGMGLGLYVCREIVDLHDGRIWASSAGEGEGATFSVWLPTVDEGATAADDGGETGKRLEVVAR